jgi:hypothetical protein
MISRAEGRYAAGGFAGRPLRGRRLRRGPLRGRPFGRGTRPRGARPALGACAPPSRHKARPLAVRPASPEGRYAAGGFAEGRFAAGPSGRGYAPAGVQARPRRGRVCAASRPKAPSGRQAGFAGRPLRAGLRDGDALSGPQPRRRRVGAALAPRGAPSGRQAGFTGRPLRGRPFGTGIRPRGRSPAVGAYAPPSRPKARPPAVRPALSAADDFEWNVFGWDV